MLSCFEVRSWLRRAIDLNEWEATGENWRRGLLNLLLRVLLLIGPIVYVLSIGMCITGGHVLIGITDTVAIIAFVALYFLRNLSHLYRSLAFALVCYMLGAVLLVKLGPISQIYLFGFSILTGLLLGERAGLICVGINGLTLLVVGLAGAASPNMAAVWDQNPMSWIVITANFLMMNGLLVIGIGAIISVLEAALTRQHQARLAAETGAADLLSANVALEREVDERKRAQEALAESVERFQLLARATTDAIWDWDLPGNAIWWNEGFEALFGPIEAGTFYDIPPWGERIHPEDKDRVLDSLNVTIAGAGEQWTSEYRFLRKDGEFAHVLGRGQVIRGEDGTPLRMIGGMTDLTERKKLEQQFLRAQRMESIGTLAGGIAHDLNNVLAPILLATEMLSDHVHGQEGEAMLNMVRGSAQRGADLVKQVLGFARGIEGERRPVNAATILKEINKVALDTFPKNISIEIMAPSNIWSIHADPTQIHQVLMNLCVNARDAMPHGGRLTVGLENVVLDEVFSGMNLRAKPGPYVLMRVEDSGVGMSEETQEKMFEPFFTTKEFGQGTGLGLSTTFSIVRDHGGFINFYSEPGLGTRFKVYLPASDQESETEGAADESALPRGNGELILLADDEEAIRDVATRALELFGYRVLSARNGAEAVSLYVKHQAEIAAVLTDMSMPVMDGPTMIVALRSINPKVRIITSSGLSSDRYHDKNAGTHAEHFVPKPYTAEVLLKTLHEVLTTSVAGNGPGRT